MQLFKLIVCIVSLCLPGLLEAKVKTPRQIEYLIKSNRHFGGHLTYGWNMSSYQTFRKELSDEDVPLLIEMSNSDKYEDIRAGLGIALQGRCGAVLKQYKEGQAKKISSTIILSVSWNKDCSEAVQAEAKEILADQDRESDKRTKENLERDEVKRKTNAIENQKQLDQYLGKKPNELTLKEREAEFNKKVEMLRIDRSKPEGEEFYQRLYRGMVLGK